MNIPDTTCHQMMASLSHFTHCLLLHYLGKADQTKYNNNNTNANVYGAIIMAQPLQEFTRYI